MGIVCGSSRREWTLLREGDGQSTPLLKQWKSFELSSLGSIRWTIVVGDYADDNDGLVFQVRTDEGLPPPVVLLLDESTTLVSHGFDVSVFSMVEKQTIATLDIDYPIYGFQYRPELDRIIVLHEVGASAFDSSWRELWSAGKDLTQRHRVTDNQLELTYEDGSSEKRSLLDGEPVA